MKVHHVVGGVFVILLLLVFVSCAVVSEVDVDYHAPKSSHSKVYKPKPKAPAYKAPKFSKRR